jgi:cell division septation protein DedD
MPRTGKGYNMGNASAVSAQAIRIAALFLTIGALAGCEDGTGFAFLQPKDKATETASGSSTSTKLVERDVEAPEVFQVSEAGLWDGRPSLGGVWVAHPDVTDPERVIIRNTANDKFVIGALFRREREIPGPRIQASSDAAVALGMLAGAPVELNVTALRREAVTEEPEPSTEIAALEDGGEISETTLDPIAGAAAALDVSAATAETAAEPVAEPTPAPRTSSLEKPYIQIGIFSVEKNADRTADQMRAAGMVPTVLEQSANEKPFWRVVVGPAQSSSERSALLKRIKDAGYSDAYFVTN